MTRSSRCIFLKADTLAPSVRFVFGRLKIELIECLVKQNQVSRHPLSLASFRQDPSKLLKGFPR